MIEARQDFRDMLARWRNRATLQATAVRIALAGGLGLTSLLAAESWLAGAGAADAAVPMADVWVTAHAIAPGSRITRGDLVARRWPAAAVDKSWLGPGGASPVGRTAVSPLAAGAPVSAAMLLDYQGSGFAAAIRPGRRAISIAVSPAGGLAGFLAPGDHVDVLLTQTLGKRRTVQTLLTDLPVLGVDQIGRGQPAGKSADAEEFDDGPAPPGLVTLEVSPGEAEALAVAAELGTLSLVLRGPGAEVAPAKGRRWDSDITGLPVALLAPSEPVAAASASGPAAVTEPKAGPEISYGLQPSEPAK